MHSNCFSSFTLRAPLPFTVVQLQNIMSQIVKIIYNYDGKMISLLPYFPSWNWLLYYIHFMYYTHFDLKEETLCSWFAKILWFSVVILKIIWQKSEALFKIFKLLRDLKFLKGCPLKISLI